MQVISVIGRIDGNITEAVHAGHRFLRFRVKADGSSDGTSFNYTVVTSRTALQEKLFSGADVYVSGHLTISTERLRTATIQALVIHVIEPARSTAEELNMDLFADGIPLQSI